jgi:hypothetical protein
MSQDLPTNPHEFFVCSIALEIPMIIPYVNFVYYYTAGAKPAHPQNFVLWRMDVKSEFDENQYDLHELCRQMALCDNIKKLVFWKLPFIIDDSVS